MTLQQTFNELTGQNQTMVQDGEYTAETVNEPRERLTKDTTLKLSQIKREEVADKRYKPGEISEATGLQKQSDGSWAEPRNKEIGKTGNFEKKQQEAENNKNYTEPALSKVSHFDLDLARNAMNTTPAEDQQLDYFITEMHEDGTSLENIIKRQDGIYERSEGRYPKEEAVYKSLREKIMKHYGAPQKTYTFIKAGHVYNVPASTPAEAAE